MTIEELKNKKFENAVNELLNENNCLTTLEILKSFAIDNIKEDRYFLAIHILEALQKNDAEYFDYDYNMGTLENPTPIKTIEDLQDYCDEEGEN